MEVSNGFKAVIKAYLDDRASNDELFAATYAKQGKSLDECCNYILSEVQKSGQNGFADEEIYGMAVHYYDEDDIKDVKPINARVVVNHHVDAPKPQPKPQSKPQATKPQDKAKQDVAAKFKTQCAKQASKSAAPSTATSTSQQDEQKRLAFMAEQKAKAEKEKLAKRGKDKPVQMSIW